MAIDFSKKYSHLQVEGFPKRTLKSKVTRGGYLSKQNTSFVPKQYQKDFVHSPDGFVEKYCKGY